MAGLAKSAAWLLAAAFVTTASAGGELAERVSLVEVAQERGLSFVHVSGSRGSFPMPAIMGSGAAVFDLEGDGDLDIYLVNGGDRFPADRGLTGARNALFRQEEGGHFKNVTEGSGLEDRRYGMGAAVGDIDNDGDADLFVSNWGRDSLYRNRGDGTFSDITEEAGVGDRGWSASAVFCDLDGDGLLDLYVTRYVEADISRECVLGLGRDDYCGPSQLEGLADRLYRNLGDGRFEDVSRSAGIATTASAGLGVVCLDFNGDGLLDLFVANDTDPNNLWLNQGNGKFVDDAVLLGLAYNRNGRAEAGMGVLAADADGDSDIDVFVSHFVGETNTYYENLGAGGFEDVTAASGLGLPSLPYTGFGDAFVDLDNDSDLDLVVVNGAVTRRRESLRLGSDWFWSVYAEPNLIFENIGRGRFVDVSRSMSEWSAAVEISRGLIAADFDRDGDLDLLVSQMEGRVQLWRNDGGSESAWIEVRLFDPRTSRETPGAQVVAVVDASRLLGVAVASAGYLTSGPLTVWFGLGPAERITSFEVRWPGGFAESFPGADARQTITLRRGEGSPPRH